MIEWARDPHLRKSAVGIATMNALLQEDITDYRKGNLFDLIDIQSQDELGVVGDFMPLTSKKGKIAKKMYIFERGMPEENNYYSEADMDTYLPQCNVVVVTATSLINGTMERILENCSNARQVVILGPSTPMCPDAFKDHKVDIIAGVKVRDTQRVLNIISQAGGTRCLQRSVEQIYMEL